MNCLRPQRIVLRNKIEKHNTKPSERIPCEKHASTSLSFPYYLLFPPFLRHPASVFLKINHIGIQLTTSERCRQPLATCANKHFKMGICLHGNLNHWAKNDMPVYLAHLQRIEKEKGTRLNHEQEKFRHKVGINAQICILFSQIRVV